MKIYMNTELGLEKRCTSCGEYYPLDNEFFYPNGSRLGRQQWTSKCKACFNSCYRKGVAA